MAMDHLRNKVVTNNNDSALDQTTRPAGAPGAPLGLRAAPGTALNPSRIKTIGSRDVSRVSLSQLKSSSPFELLLVLIFLSFYSIMWARW